MSKEKEVKWFVWEKGGSGFLQAAIYPNGIPVDGNGKPTIEFSFKIELKGRELSLSLDELIKIHRCPLPTVRDHKPRMPADLNKNTLSDLDPIEKFFPRV